jgi:hypothetical protein
LVLRLISKIARVVQLDLLFDLPTRFIGNRVKILGRVNEDVLDSMPFRPDRMPEVMGVRRETVEHPFGTLKAWMGATHFLTRTLDKVRIEMGLQVVAHNLKRMITIFGARTADRGGQNLIRPAQTPRVSRSTDLLASQRSCRETRRADRLISRVFPKPRA